MHKEKGEKKKKY